MKNLLPLLVLLLLFVLPSMVSAQTGYTIGASPNNSATGTIDDDDVSFSFDNATVAAQNEGNTSAVGTAGTTFTFAVTRAGDLDATATVAWTVSGVVVGANPAAANADFEGTTGTLSFAPTETSKNITVAIIEDLVGEEDEGFQVVLSSPMTDATNGNASIESGKGTSTSTITNDDNTEVTIAVAPATVIEGTPSGQFVYTFTRTAPVVGTLTVNFAVTGTATVTTDYTVSTSADVTFDTGLKTGTVKFAASAATATVTVNVVNDAIADAVDEETVIVTITE